MYNESNGESKNGDGGKRRYFGDEEITIHPVLGRLEMIASSVRLICGFSGFIRSLKVHVNMMGSFKLEESMAEEERKERKDQEIRRNSHVLNSDLLWVET
ncbi:hypothetical protein SLE2022_385020 [Rubroshorea leprosula]